MRRADEREVLGRAGAATRFWFGDAPLPGFGLPDDAAAGAATPPPVGRGPANPWGVHDAHGLVGEWTADAVDGAPAPAWRVTVGGAWCYAWWELRGARRSPLFEAAGSPHVGFRPVADR